MADCNTCRFNRSRLCHPWSQDQPICYCMKKRDWVERAEACPEWKPHAQRSLFVKGG